MSQWVKPKDFARGEYPIVSIVRDGQKEYMKRSMGKVYFAPWTETAA